MKLHKYSQEDIALPDDNVTDQFLDSLEKFYTFLRPHSPKTYKAVKLAGNIEIGDEVTLGMFHFSALIMISILTEQGKTVCFQKVVNQIFLWKYRDAKKNRFTDNDSGILNVLKACNFITSDRSKGPGMGTNNEIKLTDKGSRLVNTLRKNRKADVNVILTQLAKTEDLGSFEKIGNSLTTLADNLWQVVLTDADKEFQNKAVEAKKAKNVIPSGRKVKKSQPRRS